MPVLRNHSVVELVRGIKAFLSLDLGVTRGQAPDHQFTESQLRTQTRKLARSREQSKKQGEHLEQARKQIAARDRRIAGLSASLEKNTSADPGAANAPGKSLGRTVNDFHRLYYDSHSSGGTWQDTFWQGVPVWKCPLDLWIYQEIIFDSKPDVIIETGTAFGGSASFLASMCDLVGHGKVITIDLEDREGRPRHERIQYVRGSSTSGEVFEQVERSTAGADKTLVILDSDHRKQHVLEELEMYKQFVEKGSYIIVEDTNVNGHPVLPNFGPGPMEAVESFLKKNEDFIVDDGKEKFYMTFNPRGFLKKVS
ncbi:MAG: CmcI family methyltransferase [Rubrobacteraceae bacterium]